MIVVISESTAREVWGSDNPIGSEVSIGSADKGPWRTVIGVVADANHDDLTSPPLAAMYTPQTQSPIRTSVAVVKTAKPTPQRWWRRCAACSASSIPQCLSTTSRRSLAG